MSAITWCRPEINSNRNFCRNLRIALLIANNVKPAEIDKSLDWTRHESLKWREHMSWDSRASCLVGQKLLSYRRVRHKKSERSAFSVSCTGSNHIKVDCLKPIKSVQTKNSNRYDELPQLRNSLRSTHSLCSCSTRSQLLLLDGCAKTSAESVLKPNRLRSHPWSSSQSERIK